MHVGLACCIALIGCSHAEKRPEADHVSWAPPGTNIAVAPALNYSGNAGFDPVKVADLMASELSAEPGLGVIGVNRVMAVLAEQRLEQITSPEHALDIAERLGADAILVFAVTEYDPYTPVVGIAAQLYGPQRPAGGLDAVAATRSAKPFAVADADDPRRPFAQVQRTYNGAHEDVRKRVREYADDRGEDTSPMGWQKFLASQELYLRFCCHEVAGMLLRQQTRLETVALAATEVES